MFGDGAAFTVNMNNKNESKKRIEGKNKRKDERDEMTRILFSSSFSSSMYLAKMSPTRELRSLVKIPVSKQKLPL